MTDALEPPLLALFCDNGELRMASYPYFKWTAPRAAHFKDSYLDWSRLLTKRADALHPARPDGGTDYEPIFIRLLGDTPEAARTAFKAAVAQDSTLLMDPHEAQALDARIDDPNMLSGVPDEYALYRRVGTPDTQHAALFEVLDTGVPIRLDDTPSAPGPKSSPQSATHSPGTPIVAIIDDGIGFLNQRFRRGTETRFHAIWLQALESRSAEGGVLSGLVLNADDIEPLLAERETKVYGALDTYLNSPIGRVSRAHGTHVLDLAAGADPNSGDPVADWPLLAVQLPAETVDDTSGVWFESYVLQGLRWILRQAASVDPSAPVIVNLSLGVSAGPKDGSRFVECQLAREAERWEAATGQPVRLVWSFGNGYRADLNARWELPGSAEVTVRALPDDMTSSYVELHLRDAASSALSLNITTPDGTASGPLSVAEGEVCSLENAHGDVVARLYHQPSRDQGEGVVEAAHYVLAFAPTVARKTGEPVAPPGAWTIAAEADVPGELLVQIQRDDSLPGSALRGRQAHFDHAGSYDWNAFTADYTRPGPNGPVCRDGSHNALCTAQARQVVTVGAAMYTGRLAGQTPENYEPAVYTAQGASWGLVGPTVSAPVEIGRASGGMAATGLLSGQRARIGGTSAAAGRVTRALALSAGRLQENLFKSESTQLDDFDPDVLDLFAVPDTQADRLGAYVVVPLPARSKAQTETA